MYSGVQSFGLGVKQHAASAERNKQPIVDVLERVLPDRGLVLELGSGTGQHIAHFARVFPHLEWLPTDHDQVAVASVEAYRLDDRLTNLRQAQLLEVRSRTWGRGVVDGVLCIDMIHMAPWSVCEALFDGARRHLQVDGVLVLYGPFKQNGGFTTQVCAELDAYLRSRNPDWGLRDVEAVTALGTARGLLVEQVVDMPQGALCVVFRRTAEN